MKPSDFGTIAQAMSKAWGELDKDEKERYKKMAAAIVPAAIVAGA